MSSIFALKRSADGLHSLTTKSYSRNDEHPIGAYFPANNTVVAINGTGVYYLPRKVP